MKLIAVIPLIVALLSNTVSAFKGRYSGTGSLCGHHINHTVIGTCEADSTEVINQKIYGTNHATLEYKITIPQGTKSYDPNSPIDVTINGIGSFRHILLYAAQGQYHENHTGTWVDFDSKNYMTLDGDKEDSDPAGCKSYGERATLASKNDADKQLPVTFKWKPPKEPESKTVNFWGIVVQNPDQGFKVVRLDTGISAVSPWPEVKGMQNSCSLLR